MVSAKVFSALLPLGKVVPMLIFYSIVLVFFKISLIHFVYLAFPT